MSVRAKMYVSDVGQYGYPGADNPTQVDVELKAVYCGKQHASPEEEDACESHSYSKASPSAQVHLTITNPRAYEQFKVGDVYYVDFTKAD